MTPDTPPSEPEHVQNPHLCSNCGAGGTDGMWDHSGYSKLYKCPNPDCETKSWMAQRARIMEWDSDEVDT